MGKKIFVIDDDSSIGDILTDILEFESYEVDTFTTGRGALEKTDQEKPDLVLLDYFLPGERAEDIIDNFRGINDKLPIILMSASVQAEHKAKELKVNEFIPKPFQRELLLDFVGRHIE